ncbi:MAG: alpha-L-fucosidase [Planctomycetes bacterium]|nr:alpha-L-fucosidase [Planctomycetota bacterium]
MTKRNAMPKGLSVILPVAVAAAAALAAGTAWYDHYDRKAYEKAIKQEVQKMDRGARQGPVKPDWASLKKHVAAPEWFRDAKLGIYFHWGVYTVPAYGSEWYPRNMHLKQGRRGVYAHHVKTYGDPSKFGYHDFVPMFKAEHFDAEDWAELFKQAGARFAGPVAVHHDGFSMWASKLTPWNVKDMGPKRDTTGELAEAIRKRGMRFLTSFHHARTRKWYPQVEGWPTTSSDPILQLLYMNLPEKLFDELWQAKLGEVIDQYQPDVIWFDGALEQVPDEYHRNFLAYYFNQAAKWHRDVVVTCKGLDYPREVAVQDFEKGRANKLTDYVWLTDDTISTGSWGYTKGLKIKPLSRVLHDFIDIVSKNGCLLLNISPRSDGVIPDDQRAILLGLGRWLKLNGEAIYETRPWLTFGEGPTRLGKTGGFVRGVQYTAKDIRYTRSKDGKTVYAIIMGWPEGPSVTLTAVKVDDGRDGKVSMIGLDEPMTFHVNADKQLVIAVPALAEDKRPCKYAYVFKLTGFKLSLNPKAAVAPPPPAATRHRKGKPRKAKLSQDLTLDATEAGLDGGAGLEEKIPGQTNIGYWDNPASKVIWRVRIKEPGRYDLTAVVAALRPGKLAADVAGKTLRADVPATGAWNKQATLKFGRVEFKKAGDYDVILRPGDPDNWKAVNVWKLQLEPVR